MYIYRYHITTNIGTVLNNHISAPRVYPLCVAMRRRWPWGRLYRWPRVFSKQCRSYTESVPGVGGVPYSVCMYIYIYTAQKLGVFHAIQPTSYRSWFIPCITVRPGP